MDVQREVMWTPWDGPGIEHLRLTSDQNQVVVDSWLVGVADDRPFRASYTIRCDAEWRVREVDVALLVPDRRALHLLADGNGRWTTVSGETGATLDGCLDVDLSATPFTNTLPIRRLGLHPGASADIMVAFVAFPALSVTPRPQRYTRIEADRDGRDRYRYEARGGDFTADLPVDADDLVLDYPRLFHRVWPA